MQRTWIVMIAVVLVLFLASPGAAITGNYQQDFAHPQVALIVIYGEGGGFLARCSGTLVSPTVLVTAGHCAQGSTGARAYFEQAPGAHYDLALGFDPVTGYPFFGGVTGQLYPFGVYQELPNNQDLGVMVLDEPHFMDSYPKLAATGGLERLATRRGLQNQTFTVSGYGHSDMRPRLITLRERLMATVQLINADNALTDGYGLQISANPGNNQGGICYGDSGGPLFYNDTDVIVAINSEVRNGNCSGVTISYRVDRPETLEFITSFDPAIQVVPLPE